MAEGGSPLNIFVKIMDRLVGTATGILAFTMLLYGAYILYDNFSISQDAFASADLLQYKPSGDGGEEQPGFEELMEINPDVVGWLTVYDTNIDYPVVQGEDNMEYINKNVYGEFSLSGSIYLAAENEAKFSDEYNLVYGHNFASPSMFLDGYNLIYGHNVSGGAMFGDIPLYLDEDYFRAHQQGLLQTPGGNYELEIFASVVTDAYESVIYSMSNREDPSDPALMEYIRENARVYDWEEGKKITKLVAFSTCSDAETNGRIVVFANAVPTTIDGSAVRDVQEKEQPSKRRAVGHGQRRAWALLNLICVLLTVLTLFPVGNLRRKYGQFRYSSELIKRLKETYCGEEGQNFEREFRLQMEDDLKRFRWKMRFGVLAELLFCLVAAAVFLYTENIQNPMTVIDRWTPWMILIFAVALLADFLCFRYRGERMGSMDPEMENVIEDAE